MAPLFPRDVAYKKEFVMTTVNDLKKELAYQESIYSPPDPDLIGSIERLRSDINSLMAKVW